MTDIDELAARLRRLEDERDIARLIASYGPAVDAGDPDAAARLWASDGIYDVDGWRMEGRADVHAMVSSSAHQNLVANGCCHFLSTMRRYGHRGFGGGGVRVLGPGTRRRQLSRMALYGKPFRAAADRQPVADQRTYQPCSRR